MKQQLSNSQQAKNLHQYNRKSAVVDTFFGRLYLRLSLSPWFALIFSDWCHRLPGSAFGNRSPSKLLPACIENRSHFWGAQLRTFNSDFTPVTKSVMIFTTKSNISFVSPGYTPIQKTLFITKSVLGRSPMTRNGHPS